MRGSRVPNHRGSKCCLSLAAGIGLREGLSVGVLRQECFNDFISD